MKGRAAATTFRTADRSLTASRAPLSVSTPPGAPAAARDLILTLWVITRHKSDLAYKRRDLVNGTPIACKTEKGEEYT